MLYAFVGAVTALAVIALTSRFLRVVVRRAGASLAWQWLGVVAVSTAAFLMPLFHPTIPARMLEGVSWVGVLCLAVALWKPPSLADFWDFLSRTSKGEDK